LGSDVIANVPLPTQNPTQFDPLLTQRKCKYIFSPQSQITMRIKPELKKRKFEPELRNKKERKFCLQQVKDLEECEKKLTRGRQQWRTKE
jgi:hypothetical protein